MTEWRNQRQASSGAERRCRRPGGASLSLQARGERAGAARPETTRLPTRAGFTETNPADAAHAAPPKRKVRKFDSLSAATQGPTTSILRLVLRCVNGVPKVLLERCVQRLRYDRDGIGGATRCGAIGRRNRPIGAGRFDAHATESIACTGESTRDVAAPESPILQRRRRVMSLQFKSLYRVVGLVVAAQAAHASSGGLAKVTPSDCRPKDADSTCAMAVAGAPLPGPPAEHVNEPLYDGPLAGVPALGYAYWGFDFVADQTGTPSPVRPDEFVNRSSVPVTITLSFNFPTNHACNKNCLPGAQFQVDPGWYKIDPPYVINGNIVSVTQTFNPGRGFGWVVALWQSTNPRLTVTIPSGAKATLQDVGLSAYPAIANEIAAVPGICDCWDGTRVACSDGSHFSNGLLGPWFQNLTNYIRAGAFNNCPPAR